MQATIRKLLTMTLLGWYIMIPTATGWGIPAHQLFSNQQECEETLARIKKSMADPDFAKALEKQASTYGDTARLQGEFSKAKCGAGEPSSDGKGIIIQ